MTSETLTETAVTETGYLFGYARVSTKAQDLTRQLDRLTAAGVETARLYVDKHTGTDFEREGLAAVRAQLRPGDVLALDSLDRIGRSTHKMLSLTHELISEGVHLAVLGGPIPFDTRNPGPATDMAIAMLAFLSEVELIFQRERRASARASRDARGGTWGRPVKKADDMSAIWEDFRAGATVAQVRGKYGISRATAFRYKSQMSKGVVIETPSQEEASPVIETPSQSETAPVSETPSQVEALPVSETPAPVAVAPDLTGRANATVSGVTSALRAGGVRVGKTGVTVTRRDAVVRVRGTVADAEGAAYVLRNLGYAVETQEDLNSMLVMVLAAPVK